MEESGRDRIGDFMTGNLAGFASLEEAADAISAYNPHRPRPKDLSGLAKNLRQHEDGRWHWRSEEHTSELQSLMRISYAVFCLKKKKKHKKNAKTARINSTAYIKHNT